MIKKSLNAKSCLQKNIQSNLINRESINQGTSKLKELYDVKANLNADQEAVVVFLLDIDLFKKEENASMLILDSLLNDFYNSYKDSGDNLLQFLLIGYSNRYVSPTNLLKLSEMLLLKSKVKDFFVNEPKGDGLKGEICAINHLTHDFEQEKFSNHQKLIFHVCSSESSGDIDKVELENLNIYDPKYEVIFFDKPNNDFISKIEQIIQIEPTIVNLK